jgi:hypothetical protein
MASVLGYLAQPTCATGGVYREMAEAAWPAMVVGLEAVRVSGYQGTPSVLDELLRASGTADRSISAATLSRFRALCAGAGLPVDVQYQPVSVVDTRRMALNGPLPAPGLFRPTNDGAWQAVLPPDLAAARTIPDPARESFLTDLAMKLAVQPYVPTVLGVAPHYQFDLAKVLGTASGIRDPLEFVAPRMARTEKPFLKPYPDAPFREYAEGRAWCQTWLARLTASVVGGDTAQQGDLLGELLEHAGSRKTTAGRRLAEKTLDIAVSHAGLDDAVKERAARELVTLRATPPSAP